MEFTKLSGEESEWKVLPGDILVMVETLYPGHVTEVKARLERVGLDSSDASLVLTTVDRVPDREALRTEVRKPRQVGWAST